VTNFFCHTFPTRSEHYFHLFVNQLNEQFVYKTKFKTFFSVSRELNEDMICCLRRGLQSSKQHLISIDRCLKSATNRTPNVSRSLSTIDTNSSDTTYEIIEPYKWLNRKRIIHEDILKPDYADTGVVSQRYDRIKTRDQLVAIAKSCKIAKTILTEVGNRLAVMRQSLELIHCRLTTVLCLIRSASPAKTSMIWCLSCVTNISIAFPKGLLN